MNPDDPAGETRPAAVPPDRAPAPDTPPAVRPPTEEGPAPDITIVPPGPPWSIDVLADLHAGRYPAELTARWRERIALDPWASSVLAALESTVGELSLLPTPRMPERFASRLDAAIAAHYRAVTGAGVGAADREVPQPRQAADESVSAARIHGERFSGGRPPPRRRIPEPPIAGGPPATARPAPPA